MVSTRSVAVAAYRHLAGQAEPDDLRDQHRARLAQHGRLGFDASDTPAHDPETVDHRRVRVGAHERVRIRLGDAVHILRAHHAREILDIDLVDDARVGRNDLEVVEGALTPAQERVALTVA